MRSGKGDEGSASDTPGDLLNRLPVVEYAMIGQANYLLKPGFTRLPILGAELHSNLRENGAT